MASIIKKIRQKTYNHDKKFPRKRIDRVLSDVGDRQYKAKSTVCQHDMLVIEHNKEKYPASKAQKMANMFKPDPDRHSSWFRGATVSECVKCGKIDYDWTKG